MDRWIAGRGPYLGCLVVVVGWDPLFAAGDRYLLRAGAALWSVARKAVRRG